MSVTTRRLHPDIGNDVAPRARERLVADYAFEIWGSTTVGSIDIAAIFAAASVRMGDSVWVGSVPTDGRLTCRVRLSPWPVHSAGDGVDATFVLDAQTFHSPSLQSQLFQQGDVNGSSTTGSDPTSPEVYVDLRLLSQASTRRTETKSSTKNGFATPPAVRPLPLSALAARIPAIAGGHRLVGLGMLVWMYGRDPDVVRKLLENGLAPGGGRGVSAALRLFELGWREAPGWVRRRHAPGLGVDSGPGPTRTVTTGAAPASPSGRVVMDGRRALVSGALASGIRRCFVTSSHPLVNGFARLFAEQSGPPNMDGEHVDTPREAQLVQPLDQAQATQMAFTKARQLVRSLDQSPKHTPPILVVEPPSGGEVGELQHIHETLHHDETDPDGAPAASPRVTLRLERIVPDGEPLWPAWIDPLGVRIGCGATEIPGYVDTFGPYHAGGCIGPRGDKPIVLAPTTVEECFHFMTWAADIARWHQRNVVLLVDVLLLSAVEAVRARAEITSTEVAWTEDTSAPPPTVVGGDEGDVLLVGWGATRGPVEEAVARLRSWGRRVSSLHFRSLHPLPAGLTETLARFRRIVLIDVLTDRYSAAQRLRHLTAMLRAQAATQAMRAAAQSPTGAAASAQTAASAFRLVERLSTHAFSHQRPLSPGVVCDFVLSFEDAVLRRAAPGT